MATQKISEMTEAIILQDEDYVPIVQSELNKKIKIEYLRDYNKLHNKPTLNGVTIENNKKLSDYNVVKANQGIKVNSSTNQTLELEVPTNQELEQRANVNKAITIATADKMSKETAHQTMSKEYQPNSQDKLKEGENQPVSYKAVKDYVDTLETKVDTNESDIESKVSALGTEIDTLETKVDENETDIENKVSTLQQTVNSNKTELDGKITILEQKVDTNETDIEQKVAALQGTVNNNKTELTEKINTVENKVDTNETDIEQKVGNINTSIEEINDRIDQMEETGVSVADTLPIGSVIGWDSEEDYPTDIYEEVDYNPRQLLINPDFQINQRGKNEYIETRYINIYTLDCWIMNSTEGDGQCKIEKLKKGIRVTYSKVMGLSQYVSIECSEGDKFTCVLNIDGNTIIKTYQIINDVMQTEEIGFNRSTMNVLYDSTNKRILFAIYLKDNSTHDIEYIDMFPGDIAYPHVKKEYGLALARCRRKLKVYRRSMICTLSAATSKDCAGMIYIGDMDSIPTLNKVGELKLYQPGEIYDKVKTITANNRYEGDMMLVNIESVESKLLTTRATFLYNDSDDSYLEFSCESL